MARPAKTKNSESATAHLRFESKLWLAADKIRNNMDAADLKSRINAPGCGSRSEHADTVPLST
jgi:hypothetical protein